MFGAKASSYTTSSVAHARSHKHQGAPLSQDAYVKVMREAFEEEEEVFFNLWSVKAVSASQICVWRVILNKLPTRDKLIKLGIQVENALLAPRLLSDLMKSTWIKARKVDCLKSSWSLMGVLV